MEADGLAVLALAPDAQGDLLRHRAARHEDGGFFPQQLGDLALELLDKLALAIAVGLLIGIGRRRQRRKHGMWASWPMSPKEALAATVYGAALGLFVERYDSFSRLGGSCIC